MDVKNAPQDKSNLVLTNVEAQLVYIAIRNMKLDSISDTISVSKMLDFFENKVSEYETEARNLVYEYQNREQALKQANQQLENIENDTSKTKKMKDEEKAEKNRKIDEHTEGKNDAEKKLEELRNKEINFGSFYDVGFEDSINTDDILDALRNYLSVKTGPEVENPLGSNDIRNAASAFEKIGIFANGDEIKGYSQ